jgi:hypothetical protein
VHTLAVLDEQLQVDLKDRLQQAHVGALVQADLVLPDVDNQDLARGQCEQGALSLKVLVLAPLSSVGALDVHDQNVFGHARTALRPLVLAHPDALGGLTALLLGHDAELCAKQVVEQRRLARRLRAKDGDKMVVEAGGYDLLEVEVRRNVVAAWRTCISIVHCTPRGVCRISSGRDILEDFVLVHHLDAMLVGLLGGILAHAGKVRVHHHRGCGRVSHGARAALAVDGQVVRRHI